MLSHRCGAGASSHWSFSTFPRSAGYALLRAAEAVGDERLLGSLGRALEKRDELSHRLRAGGVELGENRLTQVRSGSLKALFQGSFVLF